MQHNCEQHENILNLYREVAAVKQEVAVIKTNQDHITASLVEIKQSLSIVVCQTSNNNNTILGSKGFISGVVATISILASILAWVFSNLLGGVIAKGGGK